MSDSVLAQLRTGTAAAHQRLEDRVRIDECGRDLGRYTELLRKFLGWYEPLEGRLKPVLAERDHGYDLVARSKVAWLARDLEALGLSAEEVTAAPRCAQLPRVDSAARAFGCAYVMEGATLGGRHISAMLRESPIPEEARTFFSSYGAATGERWKEFIAALEDFAAKHGGHADIVAAAQETFASMEQWVCSNPESRA